MGLKAELLNILVCPRCKGELKYNEKDAQLLCLGCRLIYRVEDDIPIMLPEEARVIHDDSES
ncbi:MAG: Trm112 family protein [Thermodesulfovibrionales bacterium]